MTGAVRLGALPDRAGIVQSIFRQCPRRYMPLFQRLHGTPRQPSGRWNTQGEDLAQYWSLSPWGAWAEFIRYNEIRSRQVVKEITRDVWAATPNSDALADLSDFDKYEACGLDPSIAIDDDHTRSRELRRLLEEAGFEGVVSPSAALPRESNVTLFGERLLVNETTRSFQPTGTPLPSEFVAASQITINAAPSPDIIYVTRYPAQRHEEYERWLAARG